jgi:hypothetical protein
MDRGIIISTDVSRDRRMRATRQPGFLTDRATFGVSPIFAALGARLMIGACHWDPANAGTPIRAGGC